MRKIAAVLVLLVAMLNASSCENKLFSYSNSLNPNARITIDRFLALLATQKCGINIIYKDSKARAIANEKMPFVRIRDYTINQIFDLILGKRGLFYTLEGNNLIVSYYKTKSYKLNFISSSRTGTSVLDATDSKVKNKYKFDFWDKIETQLNNILKNTAGEKDKVFAPIVNRNTGVIIVTGTKKQIKAVDEYIKNLQDSLTKEVLIDVKIYSVELSKSHHTGIDWSTLSLSLGATGAPVSVPARAKYIVGSQSVFKSATFNIAGLLNFLAQYGNVNSISNPKIMTLNNQKAIISVGDTIYYKYASSVVTDQNGNPQTQYTIDHKFVGVILDITPQISDNGEIILSIAPRISAFRDINQLNSTTRDMPPDTKDNTMLSVVRVKDGDTIVLGGLISDDESLKVNGVPILKEIPIIKYLFSSRDRISTKKELVFVITPHIIKEKEKKTLRDLGFGTIQ
jgi:general secretion pathway protein D